MYRYHYHMITLKICEIFLLKFPTPCPSLSLEHHQGQQVIIRQYITSIHNVYHIAYQMERNLIRYCKCLAQRLEFKLEVSEEVMT